MASPIRILITKMLSEEMLSKFCDGELDIHCLPFIEIKYNIVQKEKILSLLQQSVNVIISSQNAVNALVENFGKEILSKATWKIYCIGFATQDKIKTYFPQSTIMATDKDIDRLSDKMLLSDIDKFYFLGSNIRQQYWIDKIHQQGKQIEEYIVYNTLLKSKKIDTNPYHAIVFFSPSAVESFFQLNDLSQNIQLFAIGNTTAKALKKYTHQQINIPLKPTLEELITALKKYSKDKKNL